MAATDIQNKLARLNYLLKNDPQNPQIATLRTNIKAAGYNPKTGAPLATPNVNITSPARPSPANLGTKQTRLDFLQKNRPNDPQIPKLQAALATQQPPTGGPLVPGDPTGTPTGGSIDTNQRPDDAKDASKATGNIHDAQSGVRAEQFAAENEAMRNTQLQNPNQITAFGTQEITTDENGNIIQTQKLSDDQQKILDQGEGLTQTGQALAAQQLGQSGFGQAFNPNLTARTESGDLIADRKRIEDALFAKMTPDIDRREAEAQKAAEQSLYNKGIPWSADPDSRFQQELKRVSTNFASERDSARQSAIGLGGQEYQRGVGIQETMRANDFSQAQGTRDQNMQEISGLQQQGTGLMVPNFNQYQGGVYDPMNPMNVYTTIEGLKDVDKELGIKNAALAAANARAGGGGGGTPEYDNGGAFGGL